MILVCKALKEQKEYIDQLIRCEIQDGDKMDNNDKTIIVQVCDIDDEKAEITLQVC